MDDKNLNNTNSGEPTPGYLDPVLGGIEPALPPGSWDRLQARKRKRRPAAFWWIPLSVLLIGMGSWWQVDSNSQEPGMAAATEAKPYRQHQSLSATSSKGELKKEAGTPANQSLQGKERILETGVDKMGNDRPIAPPTSLDILSEEEIAADKSSVRISKSSSFQTSSSAKSGLAPTRQTIHRSGVKPRSKMISSGGVVEGNDLTVEAAQADSKEGPAVEGNKAKKESQALDTQPKPAVGLSLADPDPITQENENQSTSKKAKEEVHSAAVVETSPVIEGATEVQKLIQPNQNFIANSEEAQKPNEAVNGNDGVVQPKAKPVLIDSAEVKLIVDSTKTIVLDSANAESLSNKNGKRQIQWQLGFLGQFWAQDVHASAPNVEGRSALAASKLRPGMGVSVDFGPVIPLGKHFAVQPTAGLAFIQQIADLNALPGETSSIHLTQQPDGSISGEPVSIPAPRSASRLLFLPQAGVQLHAAVSTKVGLFAGAQALFAYSLLQRGAKGEMPVPTMPQLNAGLNFALTPKFSLQAQVRWLTLKHGAIPGVQSSRSNLVGTGLGVIYGW